MEACNSLCAAIIGPQRGFYNSILQQRNLGNTLTAEVSGLIYRSLFGPAGLFQPNDIVGLHG